MNPNNPLDVNVFDIITIEVPNPGAANNLGLGVNINARWHILSCTFTFATDANAANRLITVGGDDTSVGFSQTMPDTAQAANLAILYHFNIGIGHPYNGGDATRLICPLNRELILRQTDSFNIIISNMQAGDQISNASVRFKQWITEN